MHSASGESSNAAAAIGEVADAARGVQNAAETTVADSIRVSNEVQEMRVAAEATNSRAEQLAGTAQTIGGIAQRLRDLVGSLQSTPASPSAGLAVAAE
jgi:methyl-accepting chemotaxis protein